MNNLDTIMKLIDAGYTKEDISSMINPVEESPAEETPAEDTKEVNQVIPNFDKLSEALDGLNKKISELDKSIQKGNILNSQLNLPKEQTAEDILASILTPEPKEKI